MTPPAAASTLRGMGPQEELVVSIPREKHVIYAAVSTYLLFVVFWEFMAATFYFFILG